MSGRTRTPRRRWCEADDKLGQSDELGVRTCTGQNLGVARSDHASTFALKLVLEATPKLFAHFIVVSIRQSLHLPQRPRPELA